MFAIEHVITWFPVLQCFVASVILAVNVRFSVLFCFFFDCSNIYLPVFCLQNFQLLVIRYSVMTVGVSENCHMTYLPLPIPLPVSSPNILLLHLLITRPSDKNFLPTEERTLFADCENILEKIFIFTFIQCSKSIM